MSQTALHLLVGTALTDPGFRETLLKGARFAVVQQFELNDAERAIVMAIQADSIQGFAAQLNEWLCKQAA